MGELYRARDTRHGRTVAIRIVSPAIAADPLLLERFLGDARAGAALSHPNIAAIYEVGHDRGHHYLASEFVTGQTLRRIVEGQPINPRRAIELAAQIADALADAYADDRVDGAIKSDHIIVTPRGNAKIIDFGLSAQGADRLAADAGHQADIRALGALLAEMLTGKSADGSVPPGALDVPSELQAIVAKALSGEAKERYESAATLAAELRSVAAIASVRTEVANELDVPPPRSIWFEALGWLVLLLMIGAFTWLVWTATGKH
jgi:serine/threonine-protein kinase